MKDARVLMCLTTLWTLHACWRNNRATLMNKGLVDMKQRKRKEIRFRHQDSESSADNSEVSSADCCSDIQSVS